MGNIPLPWSPCLSTLTEGPCGCRWRLLWTLGDRRCSNILLCLYLLPPYTAFPPALCGEVLVICLMSGVPPSLTQPLARLGAAPLTQLNGGSPAVLSPICPRLCHLHQGTSRSMCLIYVDTSFVDNPAMCVGHWGMLPVAVGFVLLWKQR